MRKVFSLAGAGLLIAVTAACAPITDRRGFLPDDGQSTDVSVGTDTKSTVLARLGNPSTIGVFDEQRWYYVSYTQSQLAYFRARTTERTVLAISFDDADTVSDVTRFGLQDGRVIAYNPNKTPTRGRELSFLEQLFGSLGRAPVQLPGEDPNLPTQAGGPRRN